MKLFTFLLSIFLIVSITPVIAGQYDQPVKRQVIPPHMLKRHLPKIPRNICCHAAQSALLDFLSAMETALHDNEAGSVLGYKLSKQGCDTAQMNFYIGYNFGPDGCLGVSTDKNEAQNHLSKVNGIEQMVAAMHDIETVACGLGKPGPGDWKYFKFCQLGGAVPANNWIIKCIVKKSCGK